MGVGVGEVLGTTEIPHASSTQKLICNKVLPLPYFVFDFYSSKFTEFMCYLILDSMV